MQRPGYTRGRLTQATRRTPSMQPVDLVLEARWIVPIEAAGQVLERHAIVVDAGRIIDISPIETVAAKYLPAEHLQRSGHALLPGFVNAHTHAASSLLRGMPAGNLPTSRGRPPDRSLDCAWQNADFVREGTRLAVAEMLRAGITSFADMYCFPDEVIRVAAAARIRAVVGLPVADTPSAWAQTATGYLDKAEELWDGHRSSSWTRLYFAPHGPWSMERATLERVRRVADQLDAPIAMHVSGTRHDLERARARHGRRPLALLAELGFLRPGFTAIHLVQQDPGEPGLLARHGVTVVQCPQSGLRLGTGIGPVSELLSAGVDVALGTDGPGDTGALDMLAETRMASLLASQHAEGGTPLSAAAALRLATLAGARALGLDDLVGSLEPGKAADMVCIDLSSLACQPVVSPLEAIVFAATREAVSDVWVAGRPVVTGHRLLGFDEAELAAMAQTAAARARDIGCGGEA